ncbi:hypothetical protein C0989_001789 [Termitomyces sp. Mn162]|nr:hypothetical protein C0989_001789 [Termitomyces sp. Mn162]
MDIRVLLANDPGPIKSQSNTQAWLKKKGWILVSKSYDCKKLVHILLLAALTSKKLSELRNATMAAVLLLDNAISDHVSDTLANLVATKALSQIEFAANRLNSLADFTAAADTRQAEALLALNKATECLTEVLLSLDTIVLSTPMTISAPTEHPAHPTWAAIAASAPTQKQTASPLLPPAPNLTASAVDIRLQQCILHDTRMVLVEIDLADESAPKDCSTTDNSALCNKLNHHLGEVDHADTAMDTMEDGEMLESTMWKTLVLGLSYSECGVYVLEFATADATYRFCGYSTDEMWDIVTANFGHLAKIKPKAYNLIAHFIPCHGQFDPSKQEHLHTIKDENGLEPCSITLASWLKATDRRSKYQAVALLKITCSSANMANELLKHCIFISGGQVITCKDLKEPI